MVLRELHPGDHGDRPDRHPRPPQGDERPRLQDQGEERAVVMEKRGIFPAERTFSGDETL